MRLMRVGVDLAKNVFQVHGVDRHEKAVWRRRLSRENWLKVLRETIEPGCEIGMESCGGAHHWARSLQTFGNLTGRRGRSQSSTQVHAVWRTRQLQAHHPWSALFLSGRVADFIAGNRG